MNAKNGNFPSADIPRPGGNVAIPAGKSLADVPKGPAIPAPDGKRKPPNTRMTLLQLLTKNDAKKYLIPYLKELGTKRKKGPWREYLEFFTANLSGDVDTFSVKDKAFCEKMVKDLEDHYFEEQNL
jgi:hypothetical protein